MLFNKLQFGLFFLVLLLLHRACPPRHRNALLLAFSLVFYFMWVPAYLPLFLADMAVNYQLLRLLQRGVPRRRVVVAACLVNLGFLGVFKYAAFVMSNLAPLARGAFDVELPIPDLLLPLGISFFSFQMLALTIDTARGHVEPVRNFREYALFVAFFPQLIAGPILRGSEFLPQLRRGGQLERERSRRGVWLIASGLVKKVVLADFLLAPFVDHVFAMQPDDAPLTLIAVYSFAFQIYFDFSGYTDIARGLALLLGFELPLNFREPYLSRSPAEFWRRWHITLSSWLRDYLYIPLGGNRAGEARTFANLAITMLLGGLWHGAAWTFVIWGALHGALLIGHRIVAERVGARQLGGGRAAGGGAEGGSSAAEPGGEGAPSAGRAARAWRPSRVTERERVTWRDLPKIVLLFHAVCFGWIFFRAASLDDAVGMLRTLVTGNYLDAWPVLPVVVVAVCAVLQVVERVARVRASAIREALLRWRTGGALLEGAVAGGVVATVVLLLGAASAEFIYFQF